MFSNTCRILAGAAFAAFAVVAFAQETAPAIVPAPAFTAEQLTALPTENWITNGGTTFN